MLRSGSSPRLVRSAAADPVFAPRCGQGGRKTKARAKALARLEEMEWLRALAGTAQDEAPPAEQIDERRMCLQSAEHLGGGRHRVAWSAERIGKHSLIVVANGALLRKGATSCL